MKNYVTFSEVDKFEIVKALECNVSVCNCLLVGLGYIIDNIPFNEIDGKVWGDDLECEFDGNPFITDIKYCFDDGCVLIYYVVGNSEGSIKVDVDFSFAFYRNIAGELRFSSCGYLTVLNKVQNRIKALCDKSLLGIDKVDIWLSEFEVFNKRVYEFLETWEYTFPYDEEKYITTGSIIKSIRGDVKFNPFEQG